MGRFSCELTDRPTAAVILRDDDLRAAVVAGPYTELSLRDAVALRDLLAHALEAERQTAAPRLHIKSLAPSGDPVLARCSVCLELYDDPEGCPGPEPAQGAVHTCEERADCGACDSAPPQPASGLDPDVVLRALAVVEEHAALGPETRAICDAARMWAHHRNDIERCNVYECGKPAAGALCEECWTELANSRAARPRTAPASGCADDATNPAHYRERSPEPIDVIEGWRLGFHLGNVVKYVARETRKGGLVDLRKARVYLDREISRRERASE